MILSVASAGSPNCAAAVINCSRRSSMPFLPLFEPLATTTNRPPSRRVLSGIDFPTSSLSRAGSPDLPDLNCQHVSVEPSQGSGVVGRSDQPSHPSSAALISVLTIGRGDPQRQAWACNNLPMSSFKSVSSRATMRAGETWSAFRYIPESLTASLLYHMGETAQAPDTVVTAVLGEGQLAAWKESLGADTAKWWRGHLRALRQNDAAGAKRADSGWGSVERAAVGAAWRIPIPAQVRGMVVGTLEVEWPPRHDSERAATSGPDTGATAAAASSCAPAPDPTS